MERRPIAIVDEGYSFEVSPYDMIFIDSISVIRSTLRRISSSNYHCFALRRPSVSVENGRDRVCARRRSRYVVSNVDWHDWELRGRVRYVRHRILTI